MKEKIKKKKEVDYLRKIGIGAVSLAVLIPIFLSLFMRFEIFEKALGDANGWLGYWGGYFGAIIGAVTVFIATSLQLKAQKSLQKETLEVQLESMIESARLNDKQQRELIISNLRINKIDSLVQELLHLNILNFEWFNILRQYNYHYHSAKKTKEEIEKDQELLKAEKRLSRREIKSIKSRITKKEAELKSDFDLIDGYLEQETFKRNEISHSSAKLKSDAMFIEGLDEELDEFRKYQHKLLNMFYEINKNNKISWTEYDKKVELNIDKFMEISNETIRQCKKRLDTEILSFEKGDN